MTPARPPNAGERPAACEDAERALLEGSADPVAISRAEAHLGRCPRCQVMRQRLLELAGDVRRAAPPLDDVTRARLLSALAPALDGIAAGDTRRPARKRLLLAAAGVGLAALVLLQLVREPTPGPAPTADEPRPTELASRPSPAAPPGDTGRPRPVADGAELSRSLSLLVPGRRGDRARVRRPAVPLSRLENDRPGLREASLDGRAGLALAGPGAVEVVAASQDTVELRLTSGALVVDYDRRRGGRLRIHSPGAVTEVVGTLFSVEVIGSRSRVAVQRGQVVVEVAGQSRVVEAGQSLASDAPGPVPMPAPTRALLRSFRQSASSAPAPVAAATAGPAAAATAVPAAAAPVAAGPPEREPLPPTIEPPAAASPPLSPPPPPLPAPVAPSLAERYRRAEAAMARGDRAEARRELEALVTGGGRAPLASLARYELAQIALRTGDGVSALRWLDDLAATSLTADLDEAVRFLRCEVALATSAEQARGCLEAFRAAHPASTRDPLALGLLLRILPAAELCGPRRALLDEFLSRHPRHHFSTELAARRKACR